MNDISGRASPRRLHRGLIDETDAVGLVVDARRHRGQQVVNTGSLAADGVLSINVFVAPELILALLDGGGAFHNTIVGKLRAAIANGSAGITIAQVGNNAEVKTRPGV